MKYLNETTFLKNFQKVSEDAVTSDSAFKELFSGYANMEELRDVFDTAMQIMEAETAEQLKGLSLEKIVQCFRYQDEIHQFIFGNGECAGNYFLRVTKRFPAMKTLRTGKRRVL